MWRRFSTLAQKLRKNIDTADLLSAVPKTAMQSAPQDMSGFHKTKKHVNMLGKIELSQSVKAFDKMRATHFCVEISIAMFFLATENPFDLVPFDFCTLLPSNHSESDSRKSILFLFNLKNKMHTSCRISMQNRSFSWWKPKRGPVEIRRMLSSFSWPMKSGIRAHHGMDLLHKKGKRSVFHRFCWSLLSATGLFFFFSCHSMHQHAVPLTDDSIFSLLLRRSTQWRKETHVILLLGEDHPVCVYVCLCGWAVHHSSPSHDARSKSIFCRFPASVLMVTWVSFWTFKAFFFHPDSFHDPPSLRLLPCSCRFHAADFSSPPSDRLTRIFPIRLLRCWCQKTSSLCFGPPIDKCRLLDSVPESGMNDDREMSIQCTVYDTAGNVHGNDDACSLCSRW